MKVDVAVIGAGPAGSVAAALCAQGGLRTVLLDRERFPREKVCGDCLNPAAWEVLDRLDVAGSLGGRRHRLPGSVEFRSISGKSFTVDLAATSSRPEWVIRRSDLDAVLASRAVDLGAEFRENTSVLSVQPDGRVETSSGGIQASFVVAADGRNSSTGRSLGCLPRSRPDRVAIQAHIPKPVFLQSTIAMALHPEGYEGLADLDDETANLCLVARPRDLPALRDRVSDRLHLRADQPWRSISPLDRRDGIPRVGRVLFAGDSARVVEPFTGEGITYALHGGALAAGAVLRAAARGEAELDHYPPALHRLYRGRLWINRLARLAVLHPRMASTALETFGVAHWVLPLLTSKVSRVPIVCRC